MWKRLPLVVALVCGLLIVATGEAHAEKTRFARATKEKGPLKKCPSGSFEDARLDDLKKGPECWSCPSGYSRTTRGITSDKACKKRIKGKKTKAKYKYNTGSLLKKCKRGTFPAALTSKCYACPSGYKHNGLKKPSKKGVCYKKDYTSYKAATKKAKLGCPEGAFKDPRLDKIGTGTQCWSCPGKMKRNLRGVTSEKACQGKFANLSKLAKALSPSLSMLDRGALRLESYASRLHGDLKNKRSDNVHEIAKPHEWYNRTGASTYKSLSIGIGADMSAGVGATLERGVAYTLKPDLTAQGQNGLSKVLQGREYVSMGWTIGLSLGLDSSIALSLWKDDINDLAGEARAIVVAGSYGYAGAGIVFWFPGKEDDDKIKDRLLSAGKTDYKWLLDNHIGVSVLFGSGAGLELVEFMTAVTVLGRPIYGSPHQILPTPTKSGTVSYSKREAPPANKQGSSTVSKAKKTRVSKLRKLRKVEKVQTGGTQWKKCAGEGGLCKFRGPRTMRYGAKNKWVTRTVKGTTACSHRVFGDPIRGTRKSCQVSVPSANSPTCARENGTCRVKGVRRVFYGAGDAWVSKRVKGSVACNNRVFGDPIPGRVKSCKLGN